MTPAPDQGSEGIPPPPPNLLIPPVLSVILCVSHPDSHLHLPNLSPVLCLLVPSPPQSPVSHLLSLFLRSGHLSVPSLSLPKHWPNFSFSPQTSLFLFQSLPRTNSVSHPISNSREPSDLPTSAFLTRLLLLPHLRIGCWWPGG